MTSLFPGGDGKKPVWPETTIKDCYAAVVINDTGSWSYSEPSGIYTAYDVAMAKRQVVQTIPTGERFRLAALRAYNAGRLRDHRLWANAAGEEMWRNRHVPLVHRGEM